MGYYKFIQARGSPGLEKHCIYSFVLLPSARFSFRFLRDGVVKDYAGSQIRKRMTLIIKEIQCLSSITPPMLGINTT